MRPLAVVLLSVAIASSTNSAAVCTAMCTMHAAGSGVVGTSTRLPLSPHHHGAAEATALIRCAAAQSIRTLGAGNCGDMDQDAATQESAKLHFNEYFADVVDRLVVASPMAAVALRVDLHKTGPPQASSLSFISLRI